MFCPDCGNVHVIISRADSGDEFYPVEEIVRCAECHAVISKTLKVE